MLSYELPGVSECIEKCLLLSLYFLWRSMCPLRDQLTVFVSYIIEYSDLVVLKFCENNIDYCYVALKKLYSSWM
jgi:hypothetical protein